MAYPREQLHEFEELILDMHPHWWFMSRAIFAMIGSLIFAGFMLFVAPENTFGDGIKLLAALVLLVSLGWFLVRFIKWVSADFVLTTDRIIHREGVIAKRGIEIPLERINTIFFKQRIIERMLGLGDLEIESASKDGAQVFEDIRKPNAVQNEIYRQMELNQNRQADRVSQGIGHQMDQWQTQVQPQPQAAPPDIPEQIRKLSELRDQGHISEEEFQAKKAELLGRM